MPFASRVCETKPTKPNSFVLLHSWHFLLLLSSRGRRGCGSIETRKVARFVERDGYGARRFCIGQDPPIRHGWRSYRIATMLTFFGVGDSQATAHAGCRIIKLPRLHAMEMVLFGLLPTGAGRNITNGVLLLRLWWLVRMLLMCRSTP